MKSFSNKYIFIYSTVLVAVVAVILSVVSTSLKPLQERNQRVETKQMLLRTIGVESTTENAEELYATYITETQTADGKPYFRFDGGIVLPLKGTGLWGPIWGYMALDADGNVLEGTHQWMSLGDGAELISGEQKGAGSTKITVKYSTPGEKGPMVTWNGKSVSCDRNELDEDDFDPLLEVEAMPETSASADPED
jgi:hypothetical protein